MHVTEITTFEKLVENIKTIIEKNDYSDRSKDFLNGMLVGMESILIELHKTPEAYKEKLKSNGLICGVNYFI